MRWQAAISSRREAVHLGVPLDEIQERLDDVFSAGYSVSAFIDWYSGEASVWVKRGVDKPVSKFTAGSTAQHGFHPVPGRSPELCTEQLGVVGPWHERLAHFHPKPTLDAGTELQSEFFLPRKVAQRAVTSLREIGSLIACGLLVSEMRTGPCG